MICAEVFVAIGTRVCFTIRVECAQMNTRVSTPGRVVYVFVVVLSGTDTTDDRAVAVQTQESGGVFVGHDLPAAALYGVTAGGERVGVSAQGGVGGHPGGYG